MFTNKKEHNKNYTYANVKKWTSRKKLDIFTLDHIVVPIHEGTHWACAMIDMINRCINYYDSLGLSLPNPGCLEGLLRWLLDFITM